MTTTATSSGTTTMSVRELIRELVELQDRLDEVRAEEQAQRGPGNPLRHELIRLSHREGQVIAALRRYRAR